MRLAWELTGRSDELRLIEAALADPDSAGVLVRGVAGVGKSRVAREALTAAADAGCEIRWVGATTSAKALPLGAFGFWADAASADPLHLVRGTIEALTAVPDGATVVVAVDDAHLLDDMSIFVVHQLVQRRAAKVLLTVRDDEPVSDSLQEVWRAGRFVRLHLQALTRDEITDLLMTTLGGFVDPDAVRRLCELTGGNVLYLRNIVDQEVADGRLRQGHGSWWWSGDPVIPPGLVELIESRIGGPTGPVSDVLDALAVGEPLELGSLCRITDTRAVEQADRRGLISVETVGRRIEVRLAHPLYGEVRRKRAPVTSLRRLRGLVAAELTRGDDGTDVRTVVRRATLTLESDLDADAELLLGAARGAVWLADLALAERLADAAIRAGAGAEANFVRAHVLSIISRGEEAVAVLEAYPQQQLTDADRGRLAFLRSHITLFTLADPAGAKRMIDDASRTATSRERPCIDAFLALYWAVTGVPKAAIDVSGTFSFDDLPAVIGAGTAMAVSVAYGDAGRTDEAVAAATVGYSLAQRSFDAAAMRFVVADGHVGALVQAGRIGEAREVADRTYQQSADLPGAAHLFSTGEVGLVALAAGELELACLRLQLVVEAFRSSGDTTGWGYRYHLPYAVALAVRGSVGSATAALARLTQDRHPSWRYLDYELGLARAWATAAEGATSTAIAIVNDAAEEARDNGQFAAEVLCRQVAAQFGDRTVGPRLRELSTMVEGPRIGVALRFATALGDRDGIDLAAVSEDFQRMGDRIAACDAAAHASMAYRGRGLRGSALACAARARALAQEGGGAMTPALRLAADPLPLTDREREIVMLIAEGLTNREISERLVVSVRTVETHVYKAMARTGTTTRHQLAALLSPSAWPR